MAVPASRLLDFSPLILGLLAGLAVLYFDFGPPLAFNDDWVYAWSAQHTDLSGIQRFPTATASAFVQAAWGQLATFGHPWEPFLRLSLLPFVLLASVSSYRIARNLEADRVWSSVAAVALLTTPIYLNLATSFMSDVPYIALMLAAADAGVGWVRFGKARGRFLLWTVLATLQRQVGLGLPLALTVALLLGWKTRRPSHRDLAWLAAAWAAVIVVFLAPAVLGLRTPVEQAQVDIVSGINPDMMTRAIGFLPAILGIVLLPFAVALLFQPLALRSGERLSSWDLTTLASLVLGAVGTYAAVTHLTNGDNFVGKQVFPGDIWEPLGFVVTSVGQKPPVYSEGTWLGIGLFAIASSAILLILRARIWAGLARRPAGSFLILACALQAGEIINALVFDRHLLAPAALLVPLVAAAASRTTRPKLALGWAVASCIAGIGLYGVAEQDYEAWQAAREKAVQFAYGFAPKDLVYAGYEPTASYVVIPEFDMTGSYDVSSAAQLLRSGPATPVLWVFFAGPNDPHPGVPYDSIAPGKMIILGNLPPGAGSPTGH